MKKQENQRRALAGLTAFALVATQIPAPALAEITAKGASEAAAEQQVDVTGAAETGNSGTGAAATEGTSQDTSGNATGGTDSTTSGSQDGDKSGASETGTATGNGSANSSSVANGSSNTNSSSNSKGSATETDQNAANAGTTTQETVSPADNANDTFTLKLPAGQIGRSKLYSELNRHYNYLYSSFKIKNASGVEEEVKSDSSGDLMLSGSYEVQGKWPFPSPWGDLGTLSITRTWTVSFDVQSCEQGGVNVDVVQNVDEGKGVEFTVNTVDSFDIESVTANDAVLSPIQGTTYAVNDVKADTQVIITYKAKKTASVSVTTGNATVRIYGTSVSSDGNVRIAAEKDGTLTVTPEDGYAVTGASFNGKDLDLRYENHVATAPLCALAEDSENTLVVTTVKCGLVAKAEAVDAGLAGRDASEYGKIIFDAVLDTDASIPSGLTLDDVTVKYDAGGSSGWQNLDWKPGFVEKFRGAHAFDAAEGGSNKVRIEYAGNDQYPGSSIEVTVNVVDGRIATHVEAAESATLQYDADFDAMRSTLYQQLAPVVYNDETGDPVSGLTQDDFEFEGLDHAAGEYTVSVKFKGDDDLKGSAATAAVTVTKAPSSTSVDNKRATYDGSQVDVLGLVSTSPSNDETKPLVIVAGIDGDAKGYISVDLSYVDPKVQNVVNGSFHLDEGVSVNTLNGYLNNDTVVAGLKFALRIAGVADPDALISSLQKVVSTLVDLGLGESTVALGGSPSSAGVYLVAGVTTSGNYETSMGLGYLTIAPRSSDVSLEFANELSRTVSKEEAAGFDYSVNVSGTAEGDAANLLVTFTGTSYAGDAYLQSVSLKSTDADMAEKLTAAAPTAPGAYVQTATTLGGNYLAAPISRAYAISRGASAMELDDFDGGTRTTTYNGEAQSATATVLDEDGAAIEGASVTYLYTGTSLNGKKSILTTKAPTDAGTYTVYAVYLGDSTHGSATATGTIVIQAAEVEFSLGDLATVYGAECDHSKVGYSVDGEEGERGLLSQEQVDAILATVTCEGDAHDHEVNTDPGYVMSAEVPASVAADKNMSITVTGGHHKVTTSKVKVVVADASKLYGDSDPSFTAVVYDAETGDPIANQEQILQSLGIQYSREEGEEPGTYAIDAVCANGNFEATVVAGTLTITPGLTVKTNGMGTAAADKPGAAAGEQIKVTATPSTSEYVFTGWVVTEGDATVADPGASETTVTMGSSNATVVANFSAKEAPAGSKRKITTYAGEGGTATSTPKGAAEGETVTLKAKARDGYEFDYWEIVSGDVTLADARSAETTFLMGKESPVIKAHFKKAGPQGANSSNSKNGSKNQASADAQKDARGAKAPQTGDVVNTIVPVAVAVVAAIAVVAAFVVKRKSK